MAQYSRRTAKPPSSSVVHIIDSDDEPNITLQPTRVATEVKLSDNSLKGSLYDGNNEDSDSGSGVQFTTIPKRKQTQNVVTSESESSDDDDIPISKLKRMKFLKSSHDQDKGDLNALMTATSLNDKVIGTVTPRRRLRKGVIKSQKDKKPSCGPSEDKYEQSIPTSEEVNDDELEEISLDKEGSSSDFIDDDSDVSDHGGTSSELQDLPDGEVESDSHYVSDGQEDGKSCGPSEDKHGQSIPTNKENDDDDDESKEGSSASEEGSLDGFIVHDSVDASSKPHDDASHGEVESKSQDASDDNLKFSEILSQIQRKKDQKRKWEFEGDMLAAFGKDPKLCMKAVCTLYRQQTCEEQGNMQSQFYNGRGFSRYDAFR